MLMVAGIGGIVVPCLTCWVCWVNAQEPGSAVAAAGPPFDDAVLGRELVLNHPFLPRDFHQSVFDQLWMDWPEPLRRQAAQATPVQRREMAFRRFGFSSRTDDPDKPLQYVVDREGYWSMNCFACHGGQVAGHTVEGLPNAQLALETLYADLRRTKVRLGEPLSQMDMGSLAVPMGTTVGTSNAVVFGIALMSYRDRDLNLRPFRLPPTVVHHDMDAPPWWNVSRRERLYIDGFVQKNHRALVPFVMDQRNSGPRMRGWEDEFRKVLAYIESLQPPVWPRSVDPLLARQGQTLFNRHCATCHGTCGPQSQSPCHVVDIDEIGTDRVRLDALTVEHRRGYHESWYAHYGADDTVLDPDGYQAPPLNGIWASAPYLHNGSVPTLWHLLHPKQRPKIWWRPEISGYDWQRVGLAVEVPERLPEDLRADERRAYFDTGVAGKSAAGHEFFDDYDENQLQALLEYLKTL